MTIYKEEVIGQPVMIEFEVCDVGILAFFYGIITQYNAFVASYGTERQHLIIFEDGEERWFNLEDEENMGRLKWTRNSSDDQALNEQNQLVLHPVQSSNAMA